MTFGLYFLIGFVLAGVGIFILSRFGGEEYDELLEGDNGTIAVVLLALLTVCLWPAVIISFILFSLHWYGRKKRP